MNTLAEQAAAVAAREVSPVDLVERALEAAARAQGATNCVTHLAAEEARAAAKRAQDTEPTGPLHGLPILVKDLYDVAGWPTTGCTRPYHDRMASADAAVVERLRGAGALIIGKTNQHELAAGITGWVSSFGSVRNPWDPERIPGGSSSGSAAAVACGVVAMAMGSDTGGSIRAPASFCGITGLKPTHGAVSMRGAMPLGPDFDTAGPLATTAEDCALVHRVIADPPGGDQGPFPGVAGVRIGLPETFLATTVGQTRAGIEGAARVFEELGAALVPIRGPRLDRDSVGFNLTWIRFAELYPDLIDDDRVGPDASFLLRYGRALTAEDRERAHARLEEIRRDFARAFGDVDVLLAPATAFPAPRATDEEIPIDDGTTMPVHRGGPAQLTRPVNEALLPALAFPVGTSSEGMPIGAQLIGPAWSESWLCSLGSAYQAATDHHLARAVS